MALFSEYPSYYFHYWWENAEGEPSVQSALQILENTKDNILNNYVSQYSSALTEFQSQSGFMLSDDQGAMLDFAVDGTLTAEELDAVLSQAVSEHPASGMDIGGGEQLGAAVRNLYEHIKKTNTTLVNLSALMDAFSNATDLYSQVQDAILGEGGNLRYTSRGKSTVVGRIVKKILASPNGTGWQRSMKGGTIEGVSNQLNQWLVLLYALTNNYVPKGSKNAVKQVIVNTVRQNFSGFIGALEEVATLTASTVATTQGEMAIDKLNQDISELGVKAHVSGNNTLSYSIEIDNDEYTDAIFSHLKGQLRQLNNYKLSGGGEKVTMTFPNTQIKADQQVWSDKLQANINNVSVKSTNSIKTASDGSTRLGSITLQSSSPLLSIMYRELGFSSSDITGFLQIMMAHGSEDYTGSLWKDLRDYTRQAMLIPALTGLNREVLDGGTLVTMIKINDYMIPMNRFINYLQLMLIRNSAGLGDRYSGYISLEGFPSHQTFLNDNKWMPPMNPNWAGAKRRSSMAETSGIGTLQYSKLRLRLRNINLTTLANSLL